MENGTRQSTTTLHRVGGDGGPARLDVSARVSGAYVKAAEYRGETVNRWEGTDREGQPLAVTWFAKLDYSAPGCDIIALETGAVR